jgi:hypothetical protein
MKPGLGLPVSLFLKTLLPDLVSHHLVWEESVPHKPLYKVQGSPEEACEVSNSSRPRNTSDPS